MFFPQFFRSQNVYFGMLQVSDKSMGLPETLRNTPAKLTRSEFHGCVFPVLASLASYHAYLEPSLQQRLIKCLEFGLVSRCAHQCVMALTTCTLEMRDAMYKLLPEVLLNLSKISATVHIAIPILEFLSSKYKFSYLIFCLNKLC
jgi:tuberous sclerosis protein 2